MFGLPERLLLEGMDEEARGQYKAAKAMTMGPFLLYKPNCWLRADKVNEVRVSGTYCMLCIDDHAYQMMAPAPIVLMALTICLAWNDR